MQPTRFRGSAAAVSVCAAPWPTWPRLAHLRVGWIMRSSSRISNGAMGLRELLNKNPLPSRYISHRAPHGQGNDIDPRPHGEPDRFSRYRPYYKIYTSIVSYAPRRIQYKLKEITAIRPL